MIYLSNELSHYGVRGMKWGVRKQMPSAGGMARRALAGVYGMNERFYRKTGNKALASMNAVEKNRLLKKAQAADLKKQQMTPEERSALRKRRAKQAAAVGGTVAVAALAAYGHHKYKTLTNEMHQMNSNIKLGQSMVESLYKEKGFNDKRMYMINRPDDYLVHHGVKGMKWGVRRTPEQLGRKRAQKSGVDECYVNKAVKQAYALNRKTNKSARQSKRQMRIEEELETYINTNRNPKKDAALKRAVEKESQRSSGSKGSTLKTAAKIISPVGYTAGKGIHKAATSKEARSARNTLRNLTGSKRSAAMTKYRKKNIDGMSDADLRKAVNRMNLERQYRDLTKADYMKGQRYASDFLKYKSTVKRF